MDFRGVCQVSYAPRDAFRKSVHNLDAMILRKGVRTVVNNKSGEAHLIANLLKAESAHRTVRAPEEKFAFGSPRKRVHLNLGGEVRKMEDSSLTNVHGEQNSSRVRCYNQFAIGREGYGVDAVREEPVAVKFPAILSVRGHRNGGTWRSSPAAFSR